MPTDTELYIEAKTKYKHVPISVAAKELAADYNLSYDSVRGRLSRANTVSNNVALLALLSKQIDDNSDGVERQKEVIADSYDNYDVCNSAIFVSDAHLPYTRWDAFELTLQIIEDIKPGLITAGNDALDNSNFSRFEDARTVRGKVWSGDINHLRELEKHYYKNLSKTGATLAHVMGNHDMWMYTKIRSGLPEMAENIIADYMEWLYDLGVLQFSRGYDENYLELGESLVFTHGNWASKLVTTNAKNALSQFVNKGRLRSVVVGHTHRPARVEGFSIGYPGVTFVNSGCLSRTEGIPYLKRDPRAWGLGIVLAYYDRDNHELYDVNFVERGNKLVATLYGKRYEAKLNKEQPQEYN